ncbi:hypothetical protein GCM10028832_01780 [Streptomyces sparsus]
MPSPSPLTAAETELGRLLHGPCEPGFLTELHQALAGALPPPDGVTPGPGDRTSHRLRTLSKGLPPARRLLDTPAHLCALHAWTAVADPSLCLAALVHHTLCLGSISRLAPDPAPLEARMAALESGRAKGLYLITEVGQANSHLATRTHAEFDTSEGRFLLHTPDPAAAKFCGAGTPNVPQTAVVLARLTHAGSDHGVFAFVVDLTDENGPLPGVEMSSTMDLGALPQDYVQVRFRNVRVPYAHWLADGALLCSDGTFRDPVTSTDERLQRTLRVGQGLWAVMPSVAAATSRQAAASAVNYARQRGTQGHLAPGAPLLSYRTQQRVVLGALADSLALTCAAHRARELWTETLASAAPDSDAPRAAGSMGFSPWAAVSRPLATYKAASVRLAARIAADCQSRCGFSGHLDVNGLAAYHGFHHAFDAAGGDSQLILYDVGQFLTDQAPPAPALAESAPPPQPPGSPGWWPAVAKRHEERLTARLRKRRDTRSMTAATPIDLWNPLLEDAGLLGEFHAARLMAEDMTRVLGRIQEASLSRALAPLAALHGITAARRWAGSLLAQRTLLPSEMEALSTAADRVCDELLPHLSLLTEAFTYPQDIAPAPLAAPDYNKALASALRWAEGGTS